ncbi:hypothetical protein COL154_011665 [Colletotrichum chrysophilum]|nr:hypothetical protein COL154_011665 [Colletotrichum chrysophilum]
MAESLAAAWRIRKNIQGGPTEEGIDLNLSLETVSKPMPGEGQVLVQIHAATLNYRDLLILTSDPRYASGSPVEGLVPLSDGAGVVVEVNSKSSRWRPGDKVINATNSTWKAGQTAATFNNKVGGGSGDMDGVLQQYSVFDEDALAPMPLNLNFEEAASLSGPYVTAWNTLFGGPQYLKKGDVVVIQGTGGVSIAVLQFEVRGLMFGGLGMFQEMSAFVEKNNIKPPVAEVFEWKDAKKAYKALFRQGFVGKVAIKVAQD